MGGVVESYSQLPSQIPGENGFAIQQHSLSLYPVWSVLVTPSQSLLVYILGSLVFWALVWLPRLREASLRLESLPG